jgi:hypothetical protein
MPLSTLQETPRDVPRKTQGQDGFATSFPVGLLHPLQHAGLSRRTPDGPSLAQNVGLPPGSYSLSPILGKSLLCILPDRPWAWAPAWRGSQWHPLPTTR